MVMTSESWHMVVHALTLMLIAVVLAVFYRFNRVFLRRLHDQDRALHTAAKAIECHQAMLKLVGDRLRVVEAALDGRRK